MCFGDALVLLGTSFHDLSADVLLLIMSMYEDRHGLWTLSVTSKAFRAAVHDARRTSGSSSADITGWSKRWSHSCSHGSLVSVMRLQSIDDASSISTLDMDDAARHGHIDVVKWLHGNRREGFTKWAMNWAAKNGHIDVVKWLHENRKEGCTTYAMDGAATNGHLDIVKWLHENRIEGCTTYAMDNAASDGKFEVARWLRDNRNEGCTTWAMDRAAMEGRTGSIRWMHENRIGPGFTQFAINWANSRKDVEMYDLLMEVRLADHYTRSRN